MAENSTIHHQVHLAYRKKKFVQSVAFTTTSASVTLNAVAVDGTTIPAGALWVFQPDQDCHYDLGNAARTLTNTNSVWVASGAQEACEAVSSDGTTVNGTQPVLSHKGRTTTGNLQVYVVI